MCGIAGILDPGRETGGREEIVHAMVRALKDRGPDGSGVLSFRDITLGHTRLAILDLSDHAAQPMRDETGRYAISYNGEIYNFRELRDELRQAGFSFFSTSDTEVALKAYIHWGTDCFRRFSGMFSLAIWDDANARLVLARDPSGKKPLYYHQGPGGSLSFASTLSALRKDPAVRQTVSMEAVNCFLALGYVLGPLSLIEGVKKLEPASYLVHDARTGSSSMVRYWDYAACFREKTRDTEQEACERVRSLIRSAVQRRMVSDVPLGAFLSGGIDSTSVVAFMKEFDPDLMAFSIGFTDPEYDELPYAREAAQALSVDRHYTSVLDANVVPPEMTGLFEAFDEPFADTSLVPMLLLSVFTRSRVTVALSGDGADEIFGGYVTYQADSLARGYRAAVPRALRKAAAAFGGLVPVRLDRKVGFDYKVRQFLAGAAGDEEEGHYAWRLMYTPEERVRILGEEHRDLVHDTDPLRAFRRHYRDAEGLEPLDRHLYVDAKTWLVDDILVKLDRTTMRVGLEGRCPYLDKDLAEYVASLPPGMKVKGFKLKHLLREALTDIVPRTARTRKKAGFNAPVNRWIEQLSHDSAAVQPLCRKNEYCRFVWYVYANYFDELVKSRV